jgi:hypothetical protein
MTKRGSRPSPASAPGFVRGTKVELVRWFGARQDGWTYEIVAGYYMGQNETHFFLLVDGIEESFPQSRWDLCER